MASPKGATRYKCKSCGNSAMFVYSATAKVEDLKMWMGRNIGYVSVPNAVANILTLVSEKPVPTKCWVCGSSDITSAKRTKEEMVEIEHSIG